MIQGEVLAHPVRKRIYDHIVKNPGITFRMLLSIFDLNEGTLNYHLDYLRKKELIEIRKRKHERIYLPSNMGDPSKRDLADDQRRILRIIKDRDECDSESIRKGTGLGKKEAARALNLLSKKGLIKSRREGGNRIYCCVSEDELYRVLMMALMEKYAQGEITLDKLLELRQRMKG